MATDYQLLHSSLKKGKIYPALVKKKIDNARYIIKIQGQEVIASTQLNLSSADIYVQVVELLPKIHLKILANHFPATKDVENFVHKHQLLLSNFDVFALSLLEKNAYDFKQSTAATDLEMLKQFAKKLAVESIIPIERYAGLLANNKELFADIIDLFSNDNLLATPLSVDMQNPELFIHTLWFYYHNRLIDKLDHPEEFPFRVNKANRQFLNDIGRRLLAFNSYLYPHFALDAFLVPNENKLQLIILEKQLKSERRMPIKRYQAALHTEELENFIISIRQIDEKISTSFLCESGLICKELKKFEPAIKKLITDYEGTALPLSYTVLPLASHYDAIETFI